MGPENHKNPVFPRFTNNCFALLYDAQNTTQARRAGAWIFEKHRWINVGAGGERQGKTSNLYRRPTLKDVYGTQNTTQDERTREWIFEERQWTKNLHKPLQQTQTLDNEETIQAGSQWKKSPTRRTNEETIQAGSQWMMTDDKQTSQHKCRSIRGLGAIAGERNEGPCYVHVQVKPIIKWHLMIDNRM